MKEAGARYFRLVLVTGPAGSGKTHVLAAAGENIPYSDLNFLVEAWHSVFTNSTPEAIVDSRKAEGLHEYQNLMRRCFEEYYRVLKPGRWMTIVFSNSSNAVWRAIQEALGRAGFVVADVRTLDKEQGSFRQVTSTAVKQDLVISAYKLTDGVAKKFTLGSSEDAVWSLITEHLTNVPVLGLALIVFVTVKTRRRSSPSGRRRCSMIGWWPSTSSAS